MGMKMGGRHASLQMLMMVKMVRMVRILVMCVLWLPAIHPADQGMKLIGVIDSSHLTSAQYALQSLGGDTRFKVELIPSTSHTLHFDQIYDEHSKLKERNYIGIIGPHIGVVAVATEKLDMPYMMTSFRMSTTSRPNVFRMLPDSTDIANCVFSLVDAYKYRRVGIICEDHLESLMLSTLVQNPEIDVKLWQVHSMHSEDEDPEAESPEIRQSLLSLRRMDIRDILVLTHSKTASRILAQGRRLGITAKPYSWIFLNLGSEDFVSTILEDLITNVTAVRLVQPAARHDTTALESALVQDAVKVLIRAEARASENTNSSKLDIIKQVSLNGLSGTVDFDVRGQRNNFSLSIEHYRENTFTKIGLWSRQSIYQRKLIFYDNYEDNPEFSDYYARSQLRGTFARVVTILEKPWVMLKEKEKPDSESSGLYEGYVVDLIAHISQMEQFDYELYIVHDGNFGSKQESGEWNGIMGELLCGNATMSMAPLSINSEREDAVDFTKPFKTRGITVLIRTPEFQSSYFQFMRPFTHLVWATVVLALLVVSLALFLLEKHSRACRTDMPKLNATESFWFIFGSIVQGSTESSPVTTPGRILTSAWWFFSLILISTYTANLAAFLTVKKINPAISTVGDLTQQTKIRYGTVKNSGVANFFQNTKVEPFAKMYEQMQLMPENFVNTTQDGLKLVKEGDYAFLWDNSVNSYEAGQDCDFTEIGPAFDHKGFGIGLPQGSIHTEQLSLAILKLSDQGVLSQLHTKWWGGSEAKCSDGSKGGGEETAELELDHVAGMFFVLITALLVGFCACAIDRGLGSKKKLAFWAQRETRTSSGADQMGMDRTTL